MNIYSGEGTGRTFTKGDFLLTDSEHLGLIRDILRCEWGYDGAVMTDWLISQKITTAEENYLTRYMQSEDSPAAIRSLAQWKRIGAASSEQ